MTNNKNKDIINRSCPKPEKPMSKQDRAAQFMSFAALKGLDDKIDEAAKKERETKTASEFDKYFLDQD